MKEKTIEIVERLVIDYANLSGRDSNNRAEFRLRAMSHVQDAIEYGYSQGIEAAKKCVDEQQKWYEKNNDHHLAAVLDETLITLQSLSLDSTKE